MLSVSRHRFLQACAALAGVAGLDHQNVAAAQEPSPEQFAAHQARRRAELWGLLGDLPDRKWPIGAKLLATQTHPPEMRKLVSEWFDRYLVEGT
jgi:hypothetical protein